jgi:hypothetical protein
MFLGADVCHPDPGVAKHSVTGLVFSYDEGAMPLSASTVHEEFSMAHGLQFDDSASSASGGSSFDLNIWRCAFKSVNKFWKTECISYKQTNHDDFLSN